MIVLLCLVLLVNCIRGQPCENSASIDITTGEKFRDGSFVYNQITFPANLVFDQNDTGEFRSYGCLCNVRKCFRKCCEVGKVMNMVTKSCDEAPEDDILKAKGLKLYYMNAYQKTVLIDKAFTLFYGWPCQRPNVYIEDSSWYVQEVSSLFDFF